VLGLLAWIFARAGQVDSARAVHDEMEGRSRHEFVSAFWLATAAASAGLPGDAILQVERAMAERDPLILWSRTSPFWEVIRRDPRFEDLVRPVWS
jgi:hypothetical protein